MGKLVRALAAGAAGAIVLVGSVTPVQAAGYKVTERAADPAPASINWMKYDCGDGTKGRTRCRNQHRYYESRGCPYLKDIVNGSTTTSYYFWHACT